MLRTHEINQITITHITPNKGQTFSFNCPVCGTSHFETEFTQEAPTIWTCINGHIFCAELYLSSVDSINLSFTWLNNPMEK
jgi:hypothetical protein